MSLAQQLLDLEEQQKSLLEKSRVNADFSYFCIVNVDPIGRYSRDTDFEYYNTEISFQIIGFDNNNKYMFYTFEFDTSIEINSKDPKAPILSYRCSGSPTTKDLASSVIFFVNNYSDLTEKQRTDYKSKIWAAYEKMQDPYDARYLHRLETRNMVDYLKVDNTDLTLLEFGKEINKQIKSIVENHASSLVYEKKKKTWQDKQEITKTYTLTPAEQKKLVKTMQTKLLTYLEEHLVLRSVKKDSSYGTSDEWDVKHNDAVNYFNHHDQQVLNARKSNVTKPTSKKVKQ